MGKSELTTRFGDLVLEFKIVLFDGSDLNDEEYDAQEVRMVERRELLIEQINKVLEQFDAKVTDDTDN